MDWRKSGDDYVVRMDRGEEIMASLTSLLVEENIRSGSVVGIGAVKETVLAFFVPQSREYLRKTFPEEAELVVFAGNISMVDGAPFVHAHAIISDADFQAKAGHFLSGVIAVTGEFQVRPNAVSVRRELDDEIGIKLMRFK